MNLDRFFVVKAIAVACTVLGVGVLNSNSASAVNLGSSQTPCVSLTNNSAGSCRNFSYFTTEQEWKTAARARELSDVRKYDFKPNEETEEPGGIIDQNGIFRGSGGLRSIPNGMVKINDTIDDQAFQGRFDGNSFIQWEFPSPISAFGAEFNSFTNLVIKVLYNQDKESVAFQLDQILHIPSMETQPSFFGIVAPDPISFLRINFKGQDSSKETNFQISTYTTAAVPEPVTMAGFALAGSGLVFLRRKHRQKSR